MVYNFRDFKYIYEKENVSSLIGNLISSITDLNKKNEVLRVVSKYSYNYTKRRTGYDAGDVVLIEYWYNGMVTPVKIINKNGRKYKISHNIDDSKIKNAPDEEVLKQDILDFYNRTLSDLNYTDKVDTSLDISKSINALPLIDQKLLYKEIKRIIDSTNILEDNNNGEKEEEKKNIEALTLGKNGFNTFLKVLSALNILVDLEKKTTDIEDNFTHLYIVNNINKDRLIAIFSRFNSMSDVTHVVESHTKIGLYFGIMMDASNTLMFSYGLILENKEYKEIGDFTASKSNVSEVMKLQNPYLKVLKEDLSFFKDITTEIKKLALLKKELSNFSPSYYIKKTASYVEKDYVKISFYGVGKWDSGVMLSNDFKEIKKEFNTWVLKSKLRKSIVYNVKAHNFWTTFKIKTSK